MKDSSGAHILIPAIIPMLLGLIILVVGFAIGTWVDSGPDCPEPVVTTEYIDEIRDSLVARPGGVASSWFDPVLADSITALNEYMAWYTNLQMEVSDDGCVKVYATPIEFSGYVSVAAVDSFIHSDSMNNWTAYFYWKQERDL